MKFTDLDPRLRRDKLTIAICLDRKALARAVRKWESSAPGTPESLKLQRRVIDLRLRIEYRERLRADLVREHNLRTLVRIPRPDPGA